MFPSLPRRVWLVPALVAGLGSSAAAEPTVTPLPGEPMIAPLDEDGDIVGADMTAGAVPVVAAAPAGPEMTRTDYAAPVREAEQAERMGTIAAVLAAIALGGFALVFWAARRTSSRPQAAATPPIAAAPKLPAIEDDPRRTRRASAPPPAPFHEPTPVTVLERALRSPRPEPIDPTRSPIAPDLGGPTVPDLGRHWSEPSAAHLPLPPTPSEPPPVPRRRSARGSQMPLARPPSPAPEHQMAPPPPPPPPLPLSNTEPEIRQLPPYREPEK